MAARAEGLEKWAEALAEHADRAKQHESAVAGDDARDTFRRLVTAEILDHIGWEMHEDVKAIRWLEGKVRERMTTAAALNPAAEAER